MKWDAFIEKLRSELQGHTSEVDADAIWKGIEPSIDRINAERGRRRRWFPLLLFAGILLLGGTAYLVYDRMAQSRPEGVASELTAEETDVAADRLPASISKDLSSADSDEEGASAQPGGSEVQETVSEGHGTVSPDEGSERGDEAAGSRNAGNKKESFDHSSRTRPKKALADRVAHGKKDAGSGSGQSDNDPEGSTFGGSDPSGASGSGKDLVTFQPANQYAPGLKYVAGEDGTVHALGAAAATNEVLMASLDLRAGILMQQFSAVNTAEVAVNAYERKTRPSTDCPDFGRAAGLSFLVGVHGGVAYPFRSMTSDLEGDSLRILRDETESSLVSGNMGVDFLIRHRSGFEVGTGLQYMTLLERLDLTRTITTTETEYGLQAISINPMGDTVYIMGDVPVTTTTTERKKFYNRYRFIEIPVMLGYSAQVRDWRIGGEVGFFAGFLTKTDGMILNEASEFTELNPSNDAVSGSGFTMSYYFGASVSYCYESGVELGFHPHVRFMPTDLGAAGYPVRSKYFLAGGNVSIRYRFGGK